MRYYYLLCSFLKHIDSVPIMVGCPGSHIVYPTQVEVIESVHKERCSPGHIRVELNKKTR